ncbi:unnamed protein product [Heligmosomoides polygyrus]|uniref:M protein repeat protein n=1 Tax=Heligmosomoides polygyrus TaxID=6339 RepID=A0A3P7ZDN5_HELPZ|nr:unnamed protein product [Heligmosomoides polygyrus]
MTADFRRAFPLRSESHLRRPTPLAATPSLAQISKRLNFDDSLNTSSSNCQAIKTLELKEEVDSLKRQLANAQNDIQRLKASEENGKEHVDQLKSEISKLKRELIRQTHSGELDKVKLELSDVSRSRDEWREASCRFRRYFQCAKTRLGLAEKELRRRGLLNEEMRIALRSAWTSTEYDVDDNRENLCNILRDASNTLEELERDIHGEPENLVDDYLMDITQRSRAHDGCHDSNDTAMIFAPDQSMGSDVSQSILNSTLANTSIDYEKDEKIQRLELENSRLHDRVNILYDRAQKSMLMEEQKHDAEQKYSLLEKNVANILGEFNSLRSACAKKLFDVVDSTSQGRSAEIMKRIQDLNDAVESLQGHLSNARLEAEQAKKEVESLKSERSVLIKKAEHLSSTAEDLRKTLREENEARSALSRIVEGKDAELLLSQEEIMSLQDEVRTLKSDLAEDTTMDDESIQSKRAREEQIMALEAQLRKSEREKEETIRLQAGLTKKYRDMTRTLTGYQIKLKDVDEGICYVNSIYDELEKQFVFKINAETGIVDLLDVGQDVQSQGLLWEEEMRRYIGERHSIPGFLAAVTLQLEARRNLEDVERTQTFSVLHGE